MRVIVCGGRNYDDWRKLSQVLTAHMPITVMIQGDAPGADRLAHKWADANNVPTISFPANWKQGRKGGPLRNQFMLTESKPELVIAFPGGAGTANMVSLAKSAGVLVVEI